MVATSHPLAVEAGLSALRRGGNAVDAALAALAALCVVEPMMTGVGGDLFALIARPGETPVGVDAAGPAPADADPEAPVEALGPRSVTVPGAVGGWALLAADHGALGLDSALADAIDLARGGHEVTPVVADFWRASGAFPPAPNAGDRRTAPELAGTLEAIAAGGPDAFYRGPIAAAIAQASWLEETDLAAYRPCEVQPMSTRYRDRTIYELPPPTQGVIALEALALLDRADDPDRVEQVRCVALALEDGYASVRDGADVAHLLAPDHLAARSRDAPRLAAEPAGSTVYVAAVDGSGLCVSAIQSLYNYFGSGVIAGDTGVVLQNRGAGFAIGGRVEPGRRPFHTIIPALLAGAGGETQGPFGVVGGSMQAQGHVQLVSAVVDDGLDPQAALDRPRFRVDDGVVRFEDRPGADYKQFGGGQMILRAQSGWVGGSDRRKDGLAAGV